MIPKENNLDILRLMLSLQVVAVHMRDHLAAEVPEFITAFSGVPGFFFVSGMLVYASCMKNGLYRYFSKRFYRIFPGLLFVTLGSLLFLLTIKGSEFFIDNNEVISLWFLSQISIGQAYNPSIFRDVGTGVLNGSLWTITVEILFYLSVPLIIYFEKKIKWFLAGALCISYMVYVSADLVFHEPLYRDKSASDFLALTPITWGWMFAFGILAQKNFNIVILIIKKWMPLIFALIVLLVIYNPEGIFATRGNQIGILYFLLYSGSLLWVAFCTPAFRIPFDISYGIYLWHMVVINIFLYLGMSSSLLVIIITIGLALLSWFLVEKRYLRN